MTDTQAREVFNKVIDNSELTADQVAKLEIAREYFTNAEFRAKLQQFSFDTLNS